MTHEDENSTKALILSIDAWADGGEEPVIDEDTGDEIEPGYTSWTWNNHHRVGTIDIAELNKLQSDAELIEYMKDRGYFGKLASPDTVNVVDEKSIDGILIEFQDAVTGEPLFAISTVHGDE